MTLLLTALVLVILIWTAAALAIMADLHQLTIAAGRLLLWLDIHATHDAQYADAMSKPMLEMLALSKRRFEQEQAHIARCEQRYLAQLAERGGSGKPS